MNKRVSLKIKHFLSFALAVFTSATTSAQNYSANTSNVNKVKSIAQESGQPVEIFYEDGRVAQVVRKEKLDVFRVPISLSENSCQNVVGLKCTLVLPYIRQQHAATWKTHPSRQGKALEYDQSKNVTFGVQTFVTRSQNELYETILKRLISQGGSQTEKNRAALNEKSMGYLDCSSDITPALPATREMLYWDENFENGNNELAMSNDGMGARVNLNWRRYQNISLEAKGRELRFNRFKKAYGMYTDYYPFALSYTMQMTFRGPNLEDAAEEVCLLKWDVNFSVYFTQVLSVLSNGGNEAFSPAGYLPFIYSYENQNPFAQKLYEKEIWESYGMQ